MAESQTAPRNQSHSAGSCGKKQALISLSDKRNLDSLGKGLQELGYTIVSTGGTASTFENARVSVTKVKNLTHFPEMAFFFLKVHLMLWLSICTRSMKKLLLQNHKYVFIVVDWEDYQAVLEYLKGGQNDQQFRRKLAWKAFQHVAAYDSAVSEWLWKQTEGSLS